MPNASVAAAATGLPTANKSRRAFLTASGAAIASLAPVLTAAASAPPADTELIRLGREFDRLHAEFLPTNELANSHSREMRQRAKAIGRPLSCREIADLSEACGFAASSTRVDALAAELDGLTDKIRALPATTPEGFYAKVRAASFDCGFSLKIGALTPEQAGIGRDELDHDICSFFDLLADAERFAALATS